MKSQAKVKEDGEFEYFKFKPRSLVLEDIVDANYISDADENSAFGSDELLMEHEFTSMVSSTAIYILNNLSFSILCGAHSILLIFFRNILSKKIMMWRKNGV